MVAFLMATTASAKVSPHVQRDFNRKAYEVVKTYTKASQLSDYRDKAQFFDLFETPDMKICNDLMGLSYEPALTVEQYAELLGGADMVTVSLRDVKKEDEILEEDGKLILPISFLKRISFLSPCNTMFDSHDFFGRDYHIQMTLVYDPETGDCRIRELTSYGAKPEFPKDYRVLVQTDKRDNNLDINGKYVNFILGQKVLRPSDRIYYRGARVKEKDMKDQCDHKVFATYNDKSWRVRLNAGFAVAGFNKLGSSTGIEINKNGETSFGLDFGYIFPTTGHLRFGVFAGVGLSINNIDLSMVPVGTDLIIKNTNQDVDGQNYDRYYDGINGTPLSVKQKMSATDLAVPVYADMEYEFNSIFSIYVDAGIKFSLPMSHDIKIENSGFRTYGIYPDYDHLVIDRYINNFGDHPDPNSLVPDEDGLSAKTAIDGLMGLGARINITKSIAIDAGIQYQIGGNSWTANTAKDIFSYKLKEESKNLSGENTLNVGIDGVNLMNKAGSLKHSALKANISLIFKF